MKTRNPIFICLLALLGSSIFPSCMSSTQLQVLQPAAFALPDHITTIATVNRSVPSKKFGNVLEGVLTGESIGQDKSGRRRAIEGLSQGLTRTPRFNVKFTNMELKGSGGWKWPTPLNWHTVDSICDVYGTNAIAALEKYDSDISRSSRKREIKRKDKEGNETIEIKYVAEMQTDVRLGWRLYDPQNRQILDEFDVGEGMNWDAEGSSQNNAYDRLPSQYAAVDEVSFAAGQKYGMRIAPTWITVRRDYYPKAKDTPEMEAAARLAKSDRWTEAAAIWKEIVDSPIDPKTRGKAAYNLALACEVEGRIEIAQEWASKAYHEFGLKNARAYHSLLKGRLYDQDQLDQQMRNR